MQFFIRHCIGNRQPLDPLPSLPLPVYILPFVAFRLKLFRLPSILLSTSSSSSSRMAGIQKFGAPQLGPQADAGKAFKLAQRVEKTLTKCINSEPKQLDPQSLLVDPANRDGAPPNIQHVHFGILKSFAVKGFDRTRPQVGICVQYTSDVGKAKLLEHNRRFTSGSSLLPPVHDSKALYGTIAGSHLNVALRILAHGLPSPAADVTNLVVPGSSLFEIVKSGHKWWILPEETLVEDLVDISLWRNQDPRGQTSSHIFN